MRNARRRPRTGRSCTGQIACVGIKEYKKRRRTYREQGLHKFAHNSAKEEANEDGE